MYKTSYTTDYIDINFRLQDKPDCRCGSNNEELVQVFDKLNQEYDNNAVFLSAQGTEQK